jgi:two-component system phosphate regulon sensor histidine kinase PhoR
LNLASLEKNRIQLVLEKTDLDGFVRKTAERFLQSETGVHASIRFADESPGEAVWADQFHFGNVIQNILENAAKYCKRTPEIEIGIQKKGRYLCLAFRDNGIGIPRGERKKIFRKFYRISTGNIHDVKGFGLGLDYVGRIVKAHGWKIKVGENNNGGSVFIIMIPKKDV